LRATVKVKVAVLEEELAWAASEVTRTTMALMVETAKTGWME